MDTSTFGFWQKSKIFLLWLDWVDCTMQTLQGLQNRLNNSCKCRFRSKINFSYLEEKGMLKCCGFIEKWLATINRSFQVTCEVTGTLWNSRSVGGVVVRDFTFFFPRQGLQRCLATHSFRTCCIAVPNKVKCTGKCFYLPFVWTTLLYGTIISPPPREWFEAVFPTERCCELRLFLLWVLFLCYDMVCPVCLCS